MAQTHLRIHCAGGDHIDVPIEQIDSITFDNSDRGWLDKVELNGSWLWGDAVAGYYELLTFNGDNTYTGEVIRRATDRNPNNRYQTIKEFRDAVEGCEVFPYSFARCLLGLISDFF